MKITIEGTAKEIAALALEMQERHRDERVLLNATKHDTNDLIGEDHDIAEIARVASQGKDTCIR